jgi:molybdate-binding protein/transcriptional regulator with XRE-family HTH domain
MTNAPIFENEVRRRRTSRDWSQEELAHRAGLSRAGVSAIETGRLIPSTAAALALAAALGCRVEDLFRLRGPGGGEPAWAWSPRQDPCRYWHAEVGGRVRYFPTEATPLGVVPHDGVLRNGSVEEGAPSDPGQTLVMACCDPAVGLLASELARTAGVRLVVLSRPSRSALALLGQGLVHVAGLHLGRADGPGENAAVVKAELGTGYRLLRLARWEEGITFAPALRLPTVREAVQSSLRWVGREAGSGARQCLDELLSGRRPPRRLASDHRSVAEAVRHGWADVGVCLRLVSEEAGLDFLGVRDEAYDLCFPEAWEGDRRIQALVAVLRSTAYRRALGELPGYNSAETGELQRVS